MFSKTGSIRPVDTDHTQQCLYNFTACLLLPPNLCVLTLKTANFLSIVLPCSRLTWSQSVVTWVQQCDQCQDQGPGSIVTPVTTILSQE